MKKKKLFDITVNYSENNCFINENKSYMVGEVLTELLQSDYEELNDLYDELNQSFKSILIKHNNNYSDWENYNDNVYDTQRLLNETKRFILKLPIYRDILTLGDFDFEDLISTLQRHDELFDRFYDDMMRNEAELKQRKELEAKNVPEKIINKLLDGKEEDYEDWEILLKKEEAQESRERRYYDNMRTNDPTSIQSDVLMDFDVRLPLIFFRPPWRIDDYTIDDANAAALFNEDLHKLVDPYLDLLKTLTTLKDTYGKFLTDFIHVHKRFLSGGEIAKTFDDFSKHHSFAVIKPIGSISLEYKSLNKDGKYFWCENITFDNLPAFLYYDFFKGLRSGFIPKQCDHCGRYFLLTSGRYYDYCNTPNEKNKTCRDIGAHKKYEEKCKSDPIWLAYNRAYKAHYARLLKKNMTQEQFRVWSEWAVEFRDAALRKEVDIEEYERKIKK